ncbi:MAG: hypothetical protein ABJF11_06650 [Reichenbachiella sp.]|uniref:hypothetical protein n=1 Tax=Reichenbachiella sp. TaxID=2184521 RepID=UPI0032671BD2
MKHLLSFLILVFSNTLLFADYEKGVIYTKNQNRVTCLIEVYSTGILVGNVSHVSYIIGSDTTRLSLDKITAVEIGAEKFHVIALVESGEENFNEAIDITHWVLAKLVQEGAAELYQYYHTGNSIYANGRPTKSFGKALHERPILKKGNQAEVVYKMNYAACIKRFFPKNGKDILSQDIGFENISDAVQMGNQYLSGI